MPNCIILYHYYYPDNVISSRHFTDFAEDLYSNGWNVEVFTGNRYCRRDGIISKPGEIHNGVHIRRFKHPSFPQSNNIGRMLNSFFLSVKWFFALLFQRADVVIFGTDPQFSYFIIPFLAFFRPKMRFTVWGFDLYPEAVVAAGIRIPGLLLNLLKWWAGVSYRRCGLLFDIGSCMSKRFLAYHPRVKLETIIPWAIDEPEMPEVTDIITRRELFGKANLGILYSGTVGMAHQFEEFIALARELRRRQASVSFCFAGQGNRYKNLQDMVTPEDSNITFAGFIDEELLPLRLASADIHMISLRQGWEGVVVPSKFFGSLAVGRPLLYCGTVNSCIAEVIQKENLGFIVKFDNIQGIADRLEELNKDKSCLQNMQKSAFSFYKKNYSRKIQSVKSNVCLRNYISS